MRVLKKQPSIAIISRTVPGREMLLERALKSVLAQKYDNIFQMIVVDPPSPRSIEKIVRRYRKKYKMNISLVTSAAPSRGMEAASNTGIRRSRSDYIAFLDDDDTWKEHFLSRCITYLETVNDPVIKGVATGATRITEKVGKREIIEETRELLNPYLKGISLFHMLGENLFTNNSFLYSRDVFSEIGYYNEELPVLGDWDFNIRFLLKYDIGYIPEPLANYHIHITDDTGIKNSDVIKHHFYSNKIRNQYLRQELQSGRCGWGSLMASSFASVSMDQRLNQIDKCMDRMEKEVQSINNLVKGFRGLGIYRFLRRAKLVLGRNR